MCILKWISGSYKVGGSLFLISNFHRVLNVVCLLLDDSPTPEFYTPTFRNTLSVPSSQAGKYTSYFPVYEDGILYAETSAYKVQTHENYPEESIQLPGIYPRGVSLLEKLINPLTPNDHSSGRTAPLTSKCCISYIYSTNTGTEYFKHSIYSPFFSLQNAICFIIYTGCAKM